MCGTISTKSNPLETHRRVPLFAFRAPFPRQPVSGEACVSGSQKTPCRGIKGGEGAYPVTTTAFELRMKSLDTSARHLRLSPTRNWDLGHRCGRLRHCAGGKKRPCGAVRGNRKASPFRSKKGLSACTILSKSAGSWLKNTMKPSLPLFCGALWNDTGRFAVSSASSRILTIPRHSSIYARLRQPHDAKAELNRCSPGCTQYAALP